MRGFVIAAAAAWLLVGAVSCGASDGETEPALSDTGNDASPSADGRADPGADPGEGLDTPLADPGADSGPDDSATDPGGVDDEDVASSEDTTDTADTPPPPPPPRMRAYQDRPASSLLPPEVPSCPVIAEKRCVENTLRACEIYDSNAGDWAALVPPMTLQAFWFDRFFDLYHDANGQSMDVDFTGPVLAGTPESEWSKPEHFERYDGYGDSSGWTGTALWAAAARYAATGTEADYERMLARAEGFAFMYEINDIPGMLVRSHWAMTEEGAPHPVGHWGKAIASYRPPDDGHFSFEIPERHRARLPAYYYEGVDISGTHYDTTPTLQADASRDMYVRSMPGLLLAYDLLGEGAREDTLREVVRHELPCTLNRLKKGRIFNLQQNETILEAVTTYFAGGTVTLEEGDIDFTKLDEMVFYVMQQPHPDHVEKFDPTCPDGPPMEIDPDLEFDAADPRFLLDFLAFAQKETGVGEVPTAWSMHVSVRAGDTLFITQWALVAHYLTGDQRYLDFVAQLMGEIEYWPTMGSLAALQLPKYCAPHFAPNLLYPSIYNVLARVDPAEHPEFWAKLAEVAYTESRLKENGPREDAFFGILYNRMVDSETDSGRDDFVAEAVSRLATYGMNPDDKLEPDRKYPRNFVDDPDPDVPLESIAEGDPEWAICEEPIEVFGVEVPPPKIDGVPVRSVDPLPLPKRIGGTLLWQMDPWMVKREYGGVGMDTQWPMLGMFTPYWVGRADGVISEGRGLALGWRDSGEECSE